MKPTWAEAKVLEAVGIDPGDATAREVNLARIALDRCYYIDRAADHLIYLLRSW